jgi:hypothetical protein
MPAACIWATFVAISRYQGYETRVQQRLDLSCPAHDLSSLLVGQAHRSEPVRKRPALGCVFVFFQHVLSLGARPA